MALPPEPENTPTAASPTNASSNARDTSPQSTRSQYPMITFRVTRLPNGKIRAENRIWTSHRDLTGTQVLEGESSGVLTGSEEEMAPGPRLEAMLRDHVASGFERVSRPITVRIMYEGEGVPAGETSFVVDEYPVRARRRLIAHTSEEADSEH